VPAASRILVAVPDEILCQQLVEVLVREGHLVDRAAGGCLQVLARLTCRRSGRPDLLILDISRDRWVGLSLLYAVFCEDWELPVILVTDRSHRLHDEAVCARVRAIWSRPLDEGEILRAVEALRRPGRDSEDLCA
jgi:DNA-binding response OmpR family regulator